MKALRALITIGLAAFWLLLVAPPMFESPPSVQSGTGIVLTGAFVQSNIVHVDAGSPAYRAGLRTGEILGCLSARDYALLMNRGFGLQQGYRAGTPISTCLSKGGSVRPVRFVANVGPPVANTYGSNFLSALRLLTFLVFLVTGIALVMARPSPTTWTFYAYCLAAAPSFAAGENWTILPAWQYVIAGGLPGFSASIAVGCLLFFSVLVPDDRIPSGWRRPAFYAACAILAADIAVAAVAVFYTGVTFSPQLTNLIDEVLTVVTVLVVIARLTTMERMERARFGWAAFAIIFGVITNDLRNVLSANPSHFLQSLSIVAADLTVIMPLALMYGILKRHVIDVRFVISRTVLYAVVTTLIVGVIGAVDWLTSAYLHQVRVALVIDAAVTIGLALALHRAYGWIERGVDLLLFRDKHSAQNYLRRLAKTLLRAEREETIDRAVVHGPYERLDLTMAALFRAQGPTFIVAAASGWEALGAPAFDADHELVRFLVTERAKLEIRDVRTHVAEQFEGQGATPAIAIPIFQSDELIAFAVYGIHRDGTKLDPDEALTLEQLCDTAAQAYVRIELLRYRALPQAPLPA